MYEKEDLALSFDPISDLDGEEIIRIFNYYISNSNAAFFETPVQNPFFDNIKPLLGCYPTVAVKKNHGCLIAFGVVRPHSPIPAFRHTGVITYFIDPDFTGRGIGSKMLQILEYEAKEMNIIQILAEISSRNEGSIRFHEQHGFVHRGKFADVGIKNGVRFDTIWMQKTLLSG